jgi:hypothetical protein
MMVPTQALLSAVIHVPVLPDINERTALKQATITYILDSQSLLCIPKYNM